MARARPLIPGLPAPAARQADAPQRGQMGRQVYERLRTGILECTLLPGMALSEQSISDELRVSRAPVREAFRQLAAEGLLESIPQSGTFVARLNPQRIADSVFVREVIECEAVSLACAAPLTQRRRLAHIVRRQARASAQGDYATHLAEDEAFHREILDLAGHPHAWQPLRLARTGMNRVRHLAIPAVGSHTVAVDHHTRIVEAVLAGDAREAREAMRLHIRSPLVFLDGIHEKFPQYFEAA